MGVLTSSVSSSELLCRRRRGFVGEGVFLGAATAPSPSMERGLYLGSPDTTRELRLRTERALIESLRLVSLPDGLALSEGDEDCSSLVAASFLSADCRREWRVMVLASGESSVRVLLVRGGLSVDERTGGARLTALVRRAAVSFFFAFSLSFSFSFESLCMTSARALPTEERPKDWRMELRVVGLVRIDAPLADATWAGMVKGCGGRG